MISKPRGTNDILPSEVYKWHHVENVFRTICAEFGFEEIRTPAFEYTKLFKRGVGETTDIVQKEMFNVIPSVKVREITDEHFDSHRFQKYLDKDGFTLKPEGTAPVVRAYVENKLYGVGNLHKYYYVTPCFRHERPQAGRMRAFHQFGIETFGTTNPSVDAEVIALADTFLKRLGLENIKLHINSIGCPKCRPVYNQALKDYLKPKLDHLCETCNERYEKNPMRVLDCKNPSCQEVLVEPPRMLDYLCDECHDHFESVKTMLTASEIDYTVDAGIVRGLDYYSKTAFEFISEDIGAQSTVCGGGRYDGLVEEIGGPSTPGIGFGLGIERLLLTLEGAGIEIENPNPLDVFIIVLGEKAKAQSLSVALKLRKEGLKVELDHLDRSMKAQFKYTNKIGVPYVAILGEEEIETASINLKRMSDGEQLTIALDDIEAMKAFIK